MMIKKTKDNFKNIYFNYKQNNLGQTEIKKITHIIHKIKHQTGVMLMKYSSISGILYLNIFSR